MASSSVPRRGAPRETPQVPAKSRMLLIAFALLGLGASTASTYVHHRLLTTPAYASFCDVSERVSCTEAYLSPYGSVLGIPVAIAGMVFFAIVLLLVGVAGRPGSAARSNVPEYVLLLSTVALGGVAYLAWASYMVLGVFCVLCALTYVAVAGIFVTALRSRQASAVPVSRRALRDLGTLATSPWAIVLVVLAVAAVVATRTLFPAVQASPVAAAPAPAMPALTDQQRAQLEAWWDLQPRIDLPIAMAPGATVQIVKFSDYQCPGCRAAHDILKAVLSKHTDGSVQFVMKHYPLEAECNPRAPGNHLAACEAAAAYVMAKGSPAQPTLDDWLFANQRSLTRDVVRQAARDLAGISDFDARYEQALQEVRADASLGGTVDVQTTPTIYLNGRQIAGRGSVLPPAPYVDALVEIARKRGR